MKKLRKFMLWVFLPGLLIWILILIAITFTDAQALTIDQTNGFDGGTAFAVDDSRTWWQEINAGMSGSLAGVDLWWWVNPYHTITNNRIDVMINGWQAAVHFSTPNAWNYLDVSAANLNINAGDTFRVGVRNGRDNSWIGGSYGDTYAGQLYLDDQAFHYGGWDLGFRTYVQTAPQQAPSPTPEPATMLLLGSGLIALGAYRKKRKGNG